MQHRGTSTTNKHVTLNPVSGLSGFRNTEWSSKGLTGCFWILSEHFLSEGSMWRFPWWTYSSSGRGALPRPLPEAGAGETGHRNSERVAHGRGHLGSGAEPTSWNQTWLYLMDHQGLDLPLEHLHPGCRDNRPNVGHHTLAEDLADEAVVPLETGRGCVLHWKAIVIIWNTRDILEIRSPITVNGGVGRRPHSITKEPRLLQAGLQGVRGAPGPSLGKHRPGHAVFSDQKTGFPHKIFTRWYVSEKDLAENTDDM